MQVRVKPGPETDAMMFGGQDGLRMCALGEETRAMKSVLPGSGTWVAFSFDLTNALEILGNQGYGHHLC